MNIFRRCKGELNREVQKVNFAVPVGINLGRLNFRVSFARSLIINHVGEEFSKAEP